MTLTSRIVLPDHYRTGDIIGYHLRDPDQASEKWENGSLYKGLVWQGRPACLQMTLDTEIAVVRLDIQDASAADTDAAQSLLTALARRMLGLDQDIENFEQTATEHPQLGPLVAQQRGLRVPVAATPFEALVWAITGQQISVRAAIAIRRRVIQAAGYRYHNGLWCHPDPQAIEALSQDILCAAGLSNAKARALLSVTHAITHGDLTLDNDVSPASLDSVRDQLLAIRGIGPWTADYTLLRGYGWLDGSLHGDAAVRRALQTILTRDKPVSQNDARDWLATFSPWRALAAAHLWASQKLQA